ncbi:helix-turn-helix domain-containing protein [Mycolicibacterium sp. 120266]|uniref:helix-turn-helix domain-containing protein n=1 Tax=Mycolicibacterium sp. 120266 TaxID=3090601 RepID=UPI00299CD741|nr:helix-turn-helix domain-containing protein [Mycolicibacterium sp. 120266]MDX1874531.1 helix-turn-helix domain-containing protein [Mycolicibacterium sp. 120266]
MQVKTMGDLGALVRSARTARGMTQADLAAQLHVGRDWVIRLEKGHPRLEAQRVLDALQVVGVHLEVTASDSLPTSRHPRTEGASEVAVDPFDVLFGSTQP